MSLGLKALFGGKGFLKVDTSGHTEHLDFSTYLQGKRVVAIYFGAPYKEEDHADYRTCMLGSSVADAAYRPTLISRNSGFLERLKEIFDDLQQDLELLKDVAIVYVSSDRNEDEFLQSVRMMPWAAVQYDDPSRKLLQARFGVLNIPRVAIVNEQGKICAEDATYALLEKGKQVLKGWVPN